MERVPWPTTHTGLTPDDIPYGYSAFNSVLDDGRGYEPVVVGHEWDDFGQLVILVALSPGAYISVTVVSAGQTPGEAGEAVLTALGSIVTQPSSLSNPAREGTQGSPVPGHKSREATQ